MSELSEILKNEYKKKPKQSILLCHSFNLVKRGENRDQRSAVTWLNLLIKWARRLLQGTLLKP